MKRVHFTGIKGVGMTALALAYQDQAWKVQGSDTKELQITDTPLSHRGITVFDRFTPRNIWKLQKSKWVPAVDKLIYTAAHQGSQNVEVRWANSRGVEIVNYAKALGEFFADKKQICVCGVGGKTTTSAMLATVLDHAKLNPSWVVGTSSIVSLPAPGTWGSGNWAVIESDEYSADLPVDKTPKFMYLSPNVIICTNILHDHPDAYPTLEDTVTTYQNFFKKLPADGLLLISSQASTMVPGLKRNEKIQIYDIDPGLEKAVRNVLAIPGEYNVKNAMAAVKASECLGISRNTALLALRKYMGSKRRFEHIGSINGIELYDDYAHHPSQIRVLYETARQYFPPNARLRFVFHPHTFSRTKTFFSDFVESLKGVDEVITLPIFPSARELADSSVDSQMLARAITRAGGNARYIEKPLELVQYLCRSAKPGDVIVTVGAGDVYKLHEDLKRSLTKP